MAILLLGACLAPARASMRDALLAADALADAAEPRVVRLELRADDEAAAAVPIYGVAFTFEHCCWFYAAEYGTRILGPAPAGWLNADAIRRSLRSAGLAAERLTVYPPPVRSSRLAGQAILPNACVIGSVASLKNLVVNNSAVREAGLVLLSYRTDDAAKSDPLLVDHCLLVYRAPQQWVCIDPRTPEATVPLATLQVGAPLDPTLMTLALRTRYRLKSARLLMIDPGTLEQISKAWLWRASRLDHDALD